MSTQRDDSVYLKLIHDYFGVDIEKVWLTVKKDIPTLKDQITCILKAL